jgi:hypothetical protein
MTVGIKNAKIIAGHTEKQYPHFNNSPKKLGHNFIMKFLTLNIICDSTIISVIASLKNGNMAQIIISVIVFSLGIYKKI